MHVSFVTMPVSCGPQLHYLRLPKDIKDHYVMVLDATVATGAAAIMAIRVLLDHEVPPENILLLSLVMGESGNWNHKNKVNLYLSLFVPCFLEFMLVDNLVKCC